MCCRMFRFLKYLMLFTIYKKSMWSQHILVNLSKSNQTKVSYNMPSESLQICLDIISKAAVLRCHSTLAGIDQYVCPKIHRARVWNQNQLWDINPSWDLNLQQLTSKDERRLHCWGRGGVWSPKWWSVPKITNENKDPQQIKITWGFKL